MLRVLSIHFNRAEHMPATQSCKRVYWTESLLTRYLGAGFRLRRVRTGQVARQSGVNIQTLRYYERRGLLEAPAYTRPATWRGLDVPPILLSGDHAAIARWRAEQARRRTEVNRPDLLG